MERRSRNLPRVVGHRSTPPPGADIRRRSNCSSTPLHSAAAEWIGKHHEVALRAWCRSWGQKQGWIRAGPGGVLWSRRRGAVLASKGADVADRSALKFANRRGSDSTARILNGDQADAPKSPRSEVLKEMPAGGEMAGSTSRRRLKDILSTGPSHADHIARTRTSSMNTTVASSTPRTRIVQSLVNMATKCSPRQEKRWTTARRRTPLLH